MLNEKIRSTSYFNDEIPVELVVKDSKTLSRFKKYIFFIVCIVPLTAWLRINTRWNLEKPGFTKDYLTQKNYFQKIILRHHVKILRNK